MDYSQKIARLEEILAQMERGALPLEKVLELYQEGQTLVAECRAFLDQAEKTVKKLVKMSNDKPLKRSALKYKKFGFGM